MFDSLRVDSVRLSDLTVVGWIGIGIATLSLGWGGQVLLSNLIFGGKIVGPLFMMGFGALFGGFMAYSEATPECEETCQSCGDYVRNHSTRDDATEHVEVFMSGAPRRLSLGPLSVVAERQTETRVYCSGECATVDASNRVMLEGTDEHDRRAVVTNEA